MSPEVPYEPSQDYNTQALEFLDSIAAAQPIAGPSRVGAIQYTPNGRHVVTDDPQNPIRPRVFFLPDDPNRPSVRPSNQRSAPHKRPGYPRCADGRNYSRECVGYMDEENDLDDAIEEIFGMFNLAEKERKIAQEKLLEIRAIRLVIEREYLPRLKAGRSQLFDFAAYTYGAADHNMDDLIDERVVGEQGNFSAARGPRTVKRKRYPIDDDDTGSDGPAAFKRMRS